MSISSLTARVDIAPLLPWLGRAAALVMLAVLAWLGANIFWTLRAPESARPSALIETDLQRALPAITGRHLFGIYADAASAPASAPTNIRLNGVIAAQKPGQRAYALLTIEGKPAQLVREGEEISPGITLQRVLARQVELLRGGQTQTLALPQSGKPQTVENQAVSAGSPPVIDTTPIVQPSRPLRLPRKIRRNSDDDS